MSLDVLNELKEYEKDREVIKDLEEALHDSYTDDEMDTTSILYTLIFMEDLKKFGPPKAYQDHCSPGYRKHRPVSSPEQSRSSQGLD